MRKTTNPIGRILNGLGQRLRGLLLIPMASWRHESIDDAPPTCRVVGAGAEFIGKQGHLCAPGISAQSVGARRIHLQTVRLPPGGRSTAHKHDGHETAIHILSGKSGMWYGERLEQHLFARAGTFFTSPLIRLICPTIRAIRKAASRSLLALIPTIRRVSYCCRNSTERTGLRVQRRRCRLADHDPLQALLSKSKSLRMAHRTSSSRCPDQEK